MVYTITQLEDAIIAGLAPLINGPTRVRTLRSYGGELDAEEDIRAAVALFPAVFVSYARSVWFEHGARKIEQMTYSFVVCTRSLRSESDARRGGAVGVGVYDLLDACRNELFEQQLGLEIFPMTLKRTDKLWCAKGIAVYGQEWETSQAGHVYTGI